MKAPRIRIPEALWVYLHAHHFREDSAGTEQAAFLYAAKGHSPDGEILLVREVCPVPPSGFKYRGDLGFELTDEARLGAVLKARSERRCLVEVHNHSGPRVSFSPTDWGGQRELHRYLAWKHPEPWAALVIGPDSHQAVVWMPRAAAPIDANVEIIGDRIRPWSSRGRLNRSPNGRYERQKAFGAEGQRLLMNTKVGLVGLGGLGSAIAQQLAYLGIRYFVLIDDDLIDGTNLNREIGACPADVGSPKVEVIGRHILHIAPDSIVRPLRATVRDAEAMQALMGCDVLVGAVDNDGARAVMMQLATAYLIPYLDAASDVLVSDDGTYADAGGRVFSWWPGSPCLYCAAELDTAEVQDFFASEDERQFRRRLGYAKSRLGNSPSVVHVNSHVASTLAIELHARVAGFKAPTEYVRFQTEPAKRECTVAHSRQPDCPMCVGKLALGDAAGMDRMLLNPQ